MLVRTLRQIVVGDRFPLSPRIRYLDPPAPPAEPFPGPEAAGRADRRAATAAVKGLGACGYFRTSGSGALHGGCGLPTPISRRAVSENVLGAWSMPNSAAVSSSNGWLVVPAESPVGFVFWSW